MPKAGKARDDLEAKLDALHAAPLAEFVGARNALAKSLLASGRKEEAARVKALPKPSAAAWAVNQLALGDRKLLDALVAAGARLKKKPGDVRDALQERRQALNEASRAAERALASSGHKPNPDVQRRISATLEAIAAYAGADDGPEAGRLTADVPAPGFDEIASLGLLGGGDGKARRTATPVPEPQKAQQTREPKVPSKEDLARRRSAEKRQKKEAAQHAAALERNAHSARARLAAAEKTLAGARRLRAALEEKLTGAKTEESRRAAAVSDARASLEAAAKALDGGTGG